VQQSKLTPLTPTQQQATGDYFGKVQKDVDAQAQITQAFSREAPKAVASYAATQADIFKGQATTEPDALKKAALLAEADKWGEGGTYHIALYTAAGALGGGLSGAAGAVASANAAPLMNQLQDGIASTLQTAGLSAGAAKGIAQGVTALTAARVGAAVGGAQGAATALTVDANNRQLHPTEQKKAQELAAKIGSKYTKEQIEEQMRLMGNEASGVKANKTEVLNNSEAIAGNLSQDPGMPKVISSTAIIELPGQANTEIQQFIIANTKDGAGFIPGQSPYAASNTSSNAPTTTNTPPATQTQTASCANSDLACRSGVGVQQNAPLTAEQAQSLRENLAKQAQDVSRLAGVVSNAAAVIAPNAAGANFAIKAAVVGLGATAIEQANEPDKGKLLVDSAIDIATKPLADRFPIFSPIANEFAEHLKNLGLIQSAKDKVGK
jgi:filamentous hemagglutinin